MIAPWPVEWQTPLGRSTPDSVMTTLAFDTHKAVEALREAGFEDAQAEAVIEQMRVALGVGMVKALDFLIG